MSKTNTASTYGVAGGPIFFLKRAYWGLKPRASAQAAPAKGEAAARAAELRSAAMRERELRLEAESARADAERRAAVRRFESLLHHW